MSSMAAGANPERTNRWLLIGAAVLAVLAGVLVFALLANNGGGSSKTTKASGGPTDVLVAKNTIPADTRITADMFDRVSVPSSQLVVNPVSDSSSVVGKVTLSDILHNQQLSFDQVGLSRSSAEKAGLGYKIAVNMRALAVPVSETKSVAGLIVPDDHVDVVLTYKEKRTSGDPNAQDITRVETILQNIKVLAFAQTTVELRPALNAQGTPIANPTASAQSTPVANPTADLGQRPTDAKANPSAGTATLELTPGQVQILVAALSKGDLTLALRGVGDDQIQPATPTFQDDNGLLPGRP